MCAALMNAVACSAKRDIFNLHEMHDQKLLRFAKSAVEKQIHVVDQDGQIYRGAPPILKIASQYPSLRILAAVGQFPPIRQLLPVGYNIIATNRRFLFGPASQIFWLKATIIVAFCIGLIMSSRLWIGPRTYPLAPVSNWLLASIYPVDLLLFVALFVLAVAILVSARPQKFIFAFLAVIIVFCLLGIRLVGSRGSISTDFCWRRLRCSHGTVATSSAESGRSTLRD